MPVVDAETTRVRRLYEAMAPHYDRVIAVAERVLFADGRASACAHARAGCSRWVSAPVATSASTPRG